MAEGFRNCKALNSCKTGSDCGKNAAVVLRTEIVSRCDFVVTGRLQAGRRLLTERIELLGRTGQARRPSRQAPHSSSRCLYECCMTSPAFTPGTTLVIPFNRETFIFTKPESPEVAEFEVRLGPGGSGGGNALAHIHPKADEEFTVRSGRLAVVIDGERQ